MLNRSCKTCLTGLEQLARGLELNRSMDLRVAMVIAVMEADPTKPLHLTTLADVVHLSVSRLVHLFTAETGLPPGRYLRELRLERARQLLRQTPLSVKEVMAAVGYNDASHFSRDFKRNHGVSPQAYRRSLRGGSWQDCRL